MACAKHYSFDHSNENESRHFVSEHYVIVRCTVHTSIHAFSPCTSPVQNSLDNVIQFGYERFALEVFYDELVELLQDLDESTLHSTLNEENATSDYATWYFRILCAAHLKSDPYRFIHFLEDPDIP
jgi:hypothetical protein